MRQKYFVSREGTKNNLKIKEYAIIEKALKNVAYAMLSKETFSFLGEEEYDGAEIVRSIDKGPQALVETLRTSNMFPIGPYAVKIAESVTELYGSGGDSSVELFFDDVDLFEKKVPGEA